MDLSSIVAYLDGIAKGVAVIPEATAGAAIADGLLQIIQSALKAHQAVTGQPLDLNLLKPIDPME